MSNMLKFLRIICIWICCAFCLLERIQLPVVTAAIATPYEYFEDHDQLSYDLDTEQSKAKYDTRLLSEQMLKSEKSTEHYDESADSHVNVVAGGRGSGVSNNAMTNTELDDDNDSETDADVDDLQPHERAASCHNNGHKYTHGQKVPRLDPCEVCLCMDGEIFCWWELCTKHPAAQTKHEYHSNSQQDTSTVRLNEMSNTLGTTAYPNADTFQFKQQQVEYHETPAFSGSLALSSLKHEQEQEHSSSDYNKIYQQKQQQSNIAASAKSSKSWQKKKIYKQQHNQKQKQKQKPEQQHQHKHTPHEHAHAEAAVGNAPYYVYPPASGSKILSFPENLPSVLYHDYRTEEHQHHQHQHHQQHLKHQQKKLQIQLQQQQQQQLKQKQQKKLKQQHAGKAWQRGDHQLPQYQHDIFKAKTIATNAYAATPILYVGGGGGDSNHLGLNADWGLVDGNENVYDDIETDSDILPEPPTKKPKMTAAATTITNTAALNAAATTKSDASAVSIDETVVIAGAGATQSTSRNGDIADGVDVGARATGYLRQQQILQPSDSIVVVDNEKSLKMNAPDASSLLQSSSVLLVTKSSSSTPSPSPSAPAAAATTYVVNMATPASAMSTKIADKTTVEHQQKQRDEINPESSEEDQDDAFHRWLTSTETNNKLNTSNNNDDNNNNSNSFEDNSIATARRTNLFGLAGAHDINTTTTTTNQLNGTIAQRAGKDSSNYNRNNNSNSNKNNNKMDNIYFRSSYNDYSSEYNGSVVNIDILLTTADEQQQQQQQSQLQQKQKADLITQPSSDSRQTTATTTTASNFSSLATIVRTNASIQTNNSERQCNVMGTLYKIGDVLPQDTGNCLQCVCIDGSTSDDTPRVTCSPHNCPPLVLPDLFDATGY